MDMTDMGILIFQIQKTVNPYLRTLLQTRTKSQELSNTGPLKAVNKQMQ